MANTGYLLFLERFRNGCYSIDFETGEICRIKTTFFNRWSGRMETKSCDPIKIQRKDKNGYLSLSVKGDKLFNLRQHKCVWIAYTGVMIPVDKQINHKDVIKDNNCISNLEIVTLQENIEHSVRNKLHCYGIKNGNSRLFPLDVMNIRRLNKYQGYSAKKLSEIYDVHDNTVRGILNHSAWKHIA